MSKSKNLSVAVPLLAALHCGAAYCETPPEEKPSAEPIQLADAGTKNLTREQRKKAARDKLIEKYIPGGQETVGNARELIQKKWDRINKSNEDPFKTSHDLPDGRTKQTNIIPSSNVGAFERACDAQGGQFQSSDAVILDDVQYVSCITPGTGAPAP